MHLCTNLRELAHHVVARTQVDQDFHKVLRTGVAQSLSCTPREGRSDPELIAAWPQTPRGEMGSTYQRECVHGEG